MGLEHFLVPLPTVSCHGNKGLGPDEILGEQLETRLKMSISSKINEVVFGQGFREGNFHSLFVRQYHVLETKTAVESIPIDNLYNQHIFYLIRS